MNGKILRIPATRILDLIAPNSDSYDALDARASFPPGAALLEVHYDNRARCFEFTIQHESFPDVPQGAELPVVDDFNLDSRIVRKGIA